VLIFQFKDSDAALRFWQVVCELGIDDLEGRQEILMDFTRYGEMARVQETQRTKEQILADWSKHYRIMDFQAKREEDHGE